MLAFTRYLCVVWYETVTSFGYFFSDRYDLNESETDRHRASTDCIMSRFVKHLIRN